jgi:hypothetical protein
MTFKAGEVVMHDGVRVTSPARTWLDLASLMLALPEIRVGADSPQETRMRMILAASRLGEPTLNYVIMNAWGSQPFGLMRPIHSNGSRCSTTAGTTPTRGKPAAMHAGRA